MRTDLSANPFAGVKMNATLTARDVSGQTNTSAAAHFTLPERMFHNGLARAIIELRRRLALQDERPLEAAADLDALSQSPGGFAGHSGLYLNLVSVAALLRDDQSAAAMADAQARLWIVALGARRRPARAVAAGARSRPRRAARRPARTRNGPRQ